MNDEVLTQLQWMRQAKLAQLQYTFDKYAKKKSKQKENRIELEHFNGRKKQHPNEFSLVVLCYQRMLQIEILSFT